VAVVTERITVGIRRDGFERTHKFCFKPLCRLNASLGIPTERNFVISFRTIVDQEVIHPAPPAFERGSAPRSRVPPMCDRDRNHRTDVDTRRSIPRWLRPFAGGNFVPQHRNQPHSVCRSQRPCGIENFVEYRHLRPHFKKAAISVPIKMTRTLIVHCKKNGNNQTF